MSHKQKSIHSQYTIQKRIRLSEGAVGSILASLPRSINSIIEEYQRLFSCQNTTRLYSHDRYLSRRTANRLLGHAMRTLYGVLTPPARRLLSVEQTES